MAPSRAATFVQHALPASMRTKRALQAALTALLGSTLWMMAGIGGYTSWRQLACYATVGRHRMWHRPAAVTSARRAVSVQKVPRSAWLAHLVWPPFPARPHVNGASPALGPMLIAQLVISAKRASTLRRVSVRHVLRGRSRQKARLPVRTACKESTRRTPLRACRARREG